MQHHLLFIFLSFFVLNIEASDKFIGKAKSALSGNIIKTKFLIINPMIGKVEATKKNVDENYITHITAKVKNKIVFDMLTSSYLQKNPIVKFSFEDINDAQSLKLIVIDNMNNSRKQSLKINRTYSASKTMTKLGLVVENQIKEHNRNNPKIWISTRINDSIEQVYGTRYIKSKEVHVKDIAYSMNGAYIEIKSGETLESISIFSDTNELATIAIINIPKNIKVIDYRINIKSKQDGNLVIIAKNRKGNFYKAIYPFKNIICNVDGSQPLLSFSIDKDGKLRANTNNSY